MMLDQLALGRNLLATFDCGQQTIDFIEGRSDWANEMGLTVKVGLNTRDLPGSSETRHSSAGCEPALSVVEGDLARDAYLDMLPSRTPDPSLRARDDARVVETQRAGSKLHRFMAE